MPKSGSEAEATPLAYPWQFTEEGHGDKREKDEGDAQLVLLLRKIGDLLPKY